MRDHTLAHGVDGAEIKFGIGVALRCGLLKPRQSLCIVPLDANSAHVLFAQLIFRDSAAQCGALLVPGNCFCHVFLAADAEFVGRAEVIIGIAVALRLSL
jgi:hypothetical protein